MDQKAELLQRMLQMDSDKLVTWIESLTTQQRAVVDQLLTPKISKYFPKEIEGDPFQLLPKQQLVLLLENEEVLMHGSGAGSKTWTLLLAALQWADHPKYSGLILMRNLQNLEYIIRLSKEWTYGSGAEFNEVKKIYKFPEGGTLQFGFLEAEDDIYRYKSFPYNFIGFDELTRFKSEDMYTYLFSRLRKSLKNTLPLRVRSATNPGDVGGPWVKARFIDPETRNPDTLHVSMSYEDNKFLDREAYTKALDNLSYVERQRMMFGDWDASEEDAMIKAEWIKPQLFRQEVDYKNRVRVWDIASTQLSKTKRDPDFTAGALCSVKDGIFVIEDLIRFRGSPHEVEQKIVATYLADEERYGYAVNTYIEIGSSAGAKMALDQLLRGPFQGMNIRAISSNVPKEERARPFATSCELGHVTMMNGIWNKPFLEEAKNFPKGSHDDQVDAVVYAFTHLVVNKRKYRAKVTGFGGKHYSAAQRFSVLR